MKSYWMPTNIDYLAQYAIYTVWVGSLNIYPPLQKPVECKKLVALQAPIHVHSFIDVVNFEGNFFKITFLLPLKIYCLFYHLKQG